MTRDEKIEIMAKELAKSEQMTLADCRRWIERCLTAAEQAEVKAWAERFADAFREHKEAA